MACDAFAHDFAARALTDPPGAIDAWHVTTAGLDADPRHAPGGPASFCHVLVDAR